MRPSPETFRAVDELNSLLRQELGEPPYAWKWSDDLTTSVAVKGKYDYEADPQTGLLVAKPVYQEVPMLPFHRERWVLCKLGFVPENVWLATMGTAMMWQKSGFWQPVGDQTGCAAVNPGITPDRDLAWRVIRAIRADRSITLGDFKNGIEDMFAKRENYKRGERWAMLRDRMTTYGQKPGSRDSAVSYPSVQPSTPLS